MDAKAIHERLAGRFGETDRCGAGSSAANPWAVVAPGAIAEVAAFAQGRSRARPSTT